MPFVSVWTRSRDRPQREDAWRDRSFIFRLPVQLDTLRTTRQQQNQQQPESEKERKKRQPTNTRKQ